MKKEKEEKKEKFVPSLVVKLPKPALQPIMQRVYVKGFTIENVTTKGGLYIPPTFTKISGDQRKQWNFERYFVLAVASDVDIKVKDNGKERVPQRGDEVAIFYHEDALKYEPSEVMDFTTGEKYIALHQTEIAGVLANTIVEND